MRLNRCKMWLIILRIKSFIINVALPCFVPASSSFKVLWVVKSRRWPLLTSRHFEWKIIDLRSICLHIIKIFEWEKNKNSLFHFDIVCLRSSRWFFSFFVISYNYKLLMKHLVCSNVHLKFQFIISNSHFFSFRIHGISQDFFTRANKLEESIDAAVKKCDNNIATYVAMGHKNSVLFLTEFFEHWTSQKIENFYLISRVFRFLTPEWFQIVTVKAINKSEKKVLNILDPKSKYHTRFIYVVAIYICFP